LEVVFRWVDVSGGLIIDLSQDMDAISEAPTGVFPSFDQYRQKYLKPSNYTDDRESHPLIAFLIHPHKDVQE
jgi:hypothetical protein